jgi:hypothetical protein
MSLKWINTSMKKREKINDKILKVRRREKKGERKIGTKVKRQKNNEKR